MAISMVKIRAKITIGNLVVETPYIQSFNVNQARGQISTFSAQLKVPYTKVVSNIVGDAITIEAGRNSPQSTIFSGIVKRARISPVFDDPSHVMINMDGQDILSHLVGKKYTRRCRATKASWVTVDNVTRKGLRTGKFRAQKSYATTVVGADVTSDSNNVVQNAGWTVWEEAAVKGPIVAKSLELAMTATNAS